MDGQPWKRYVATMCGEAWKLDTRATEEVVRCVEALIAADRMTESVAVQVLLGAGLRDATADRAGMTIRIRISG